MKIFFSSSAKLDLSDIVEYIAEDNPTAARNWFNEINEAITKLSSFPTLGRIVPEYSDDTIREIIKGQYRIVYRINIHKESLCVIAIHHSKRLLK